jgi:hypothetical protein
MSLLKLAIGNDKDVRFGSLADVAAAMALVRFVPKTDIVCTVSSAAKRQKSEYRGCR